MASKWFRISCSAKVIDSGFTRLRGQDQDRNRPGAINRRSELRLLPAQSAQTALSGGSVFSALFARKPASEPPLPGLIRDPNPADGAPRELKGGRAHRFLNVPLPAPGAVKQASKSEGHLKPLEPKKPGAPGNSGHPSEHLFYGTGS